MITKWTQHLKDNPDQAKKFEEDIYHARHVLERLRGILTEVEIELGRAETDMRTYDSPNWEYRQADNNGFRRCLNLIKRLVDLDEKDKDIINERRPVQPDRAAIARSHEKLPT